MNRQRYFVAYVKTCSTNNKGRELQDYATHKLEHQIIEGVNPFETLLLDIARTVDMLNKQYPRTKPFKVRAYSDQQIEVTAGEATLLSNNAVLRVSVQKIRGTLTATSGGLLPQEGGEP